MAKRLSLENEIPTPEEIKEREERAAEVRSRWTENERIRRGGGIVGARCEIQNFVYDGRQGTFTATNRLT